MTIIRNTISGLKNLWYWLPIIWKDSNWDSGFLLIIIIHKLKSMSNAFKSDHAVCIGSKEIAHEMWKVSNLLQSIVDDEHEENAYKVHQQIYGKSELEFCDNTINILYPHDKTGNTDEERSEHLRRSILEAVKQTEQTAKEAFSTIAEKYVEWWD